MQSAKLGWILAAGNGSRIGNPGESSNSGISPNAANTQLGSPRRDRGAAGANQDNERGRLDESAEKCLQWDERTAEVIHG